MKYFIYLFVIFYISVVNCLENIVVDLSHHNGKVDFNKLKKTGIIGVIYKASEGSTYRDSTYGKSKSSAESVGLLWGAYHFGTNSPGENQAKHFLKTVDCGCGNKYPLLALDIEENEGNKGNTMSLANAEAFVNYIKEKTGKCPLIYGGDYLKRIVKGKNTVLTSCPLWLSHYSSQPTLPSGWSNYALWQYTDGKFGPEPKTVEGVIGKVDRDKYNSQVFGDITSFWNKRDVIAGIGIGHINRAHHHKAKPESGGALKIIKI